MMSENIRVDFLKVLDLDHKIRSSPENSIEDFIEVEYQLDSWGEIFPPFLGDREHSLSARMILPKFPFKLFSSSIPNSSLPQKLCLSFKCPYTKKQVSTDSHYSDFFSTESAREFTAFLSLVTRRRVFVTKQIRSNGYPIEESVYLYPSLQTQGFP